MRDFTIDQRLKSAADLVRQGAVLADVGTDHAYLPIFLLSHGIIERAVCSDINEGPLASAKANVSECGFSDKVSFHLADGARELFNTGATDYAICGMGGELIADIIDNAPHLRNPEINLILQPMSRQAYLREYLYTHGFRIDREKYSHSSGKYYVCICATYTGECMTLSPIDYELGLEQSIADKSYTGYTRVKYEALCRTISGKTSGGASADYELELKRAIEERLKETNDSK